MSSADAGDGPTRDETGRVLLAYPYLLAGAACLGLAAANAGRAPRVEIASAAIAVAFLAAFPAAPGARVAAMAAGLLLAGWWWGSIRLDAIDSSPLRSHVGERGSALVVVTGPARTNGFALRVPARLIRFGSLQVREPVQLELPLGRSPPQGAILDLDVRLRLDGRVAELLRKSTAHPRAVRSKREIDDRADPELRLATHVRLVAPLQQGCQGPNLVDCHRHAAQDRQRKRAGRGVVSCGE